MLGWFFEICFCAKCQSQGTFKIFKNWFWRSSKVQCCWEKIATVDLWENDENCHVKYDNQPLSPGRQGSSWHPSGILHIKPLKRWNMPRYAEMTLFGTMVLAYLGASGPSTRSSKHWIPMVVLAGKWRRGQWEKGLLPQAMETARLRVTSQCPRI